MLWEYHNDYYIAQNNIQYMCTYIYIYIHSIYIYIYINNHISCHNSSNRNNWKYPKNGGYPKKIIQLWIVFGFSIYQPFINTIQIHPATFWGTPMAMEPPLHQVKVPVVLLIFRGVGLLAETADTSTVGRHQPWATAMEVEPLKPRKAKD